MEISGAYLMRFLEPFEHVEADDGYLGEAPFRIKCPLSITVSEPSCRGCEAIRIQMTNALSSGGLRAKGSIIIFNAL